MACAITGLFGLVDLRAAEWLGKLLLILPHLAGVALAAWGGYRRPWAGAVALCGSGLMAAASWCDALTRETEGFEWTFNNALQGALCCGANCLLILVTASLVGCVVWESKQPPERRPLV